MLQEEFEEYAEKAKTLPENTTNENKLILYGLYKQATVGPVNTSMYRFPSMLFYLQLYVFAMSNMKLVDDLNSDRYCRCNLSSALNPRKYSGHTTSVLIAISLFEKNSLLLFPKLGTGAGLL